MFCKLIYEVGNQQPEREVGIYKSANADTDQVAKVAKTRKLWTFKEKDNSEWHIINLKQFGARNKFTN